MTTPAGRMSESLTERKRERKKAIHNSYCVGSAAGQRMHSARTNVFFCFGCSGEGAQEHGEDLAFADVVFVNN